jgi:hypothetical protein
MSRGHSSGVVAAVVGGRANLVAARESRRDVRIRNALRCVSGVIRGPFAALGRTRVASRGGRIAPTLPSRRSRSRRPPGASASLQGFGTRVDQSQHGAVDDACAAH